MNNKLPDARRKAKLCAMYSGDKKTVEARMLGVRIAEDKSVGAQHVTHQG